MTILNVTYGTSSVSKETRPLHLTIQTVQTNKICGTKNVLFSEIVHLVRSTEYASIDCSPFVKAD